MNPITLYKTDPAKNLLRFYRLDIQTDLFDNHCLISEWGRMGKRGQMKTTPFPTLETAEQELGVLYTSPQKGIVHFKTVES